MVILGFCLDSFQNIVQRGEPAQTPGLHQNENTQINSWGGQRDQHFQGRVQKRRELCGTNFGNLNIVLLSVSMNTTLHTPTLKHYEVKKEKCNFQEKNNYRIYTKQLPELTQSRKPFQSLQARLGDLTDCMEHPLENSEG